MKKCDIIIPIYNAYDCVIECIESILKYTDLEENKLILIDDKSPDERIIPLIKSYADNHKNVEVLLNEDNLGFVGTVNRGMKSSKNDVLLLNSDTEVTKDWLDKLKTCAYSMPKIATVTPLSNNATLASVPKIFVPNDIPDGLTLDEMAEIVEKCSKNEFPEIPTGHGFCLYIKREVIDDIGYFDEEAFGKGYGEENDFCFRALNKGYRHVLCDNTYIYHKESQSFSDSKKELIESGLNVLAKRYPGYKDRLDLWCSSNLIGHIGTNILLNVESRKSKPNILYIIHDWKDAKTSLGGTTLHVYDLIKNMRSKYNFHILAPEDGIYKLYSYWDNYETVVNFPSIMEFHDLRYYNSEYKKMLESIIETYGISTIHIHHLIGHYFDIADVVKEKNIYTILTLHDYYSACPLINKIYKNETYCDKPSVQKCNECLSCMLKNKNDITCWRQEWKKMFKSVSKIIVPSECAKIEINKTFPEIKMTVVEHGIDIIKEPAIKISKKKNYNVAFIGAIGIHKGSRILEKMMNYKPLKNIKLHLFGIVDSQHQNNTNYFINHGRYDRNNLKNLLKEHNIDLICLFSTWPETYSYTLTEAIACGIPVLSYDIGAIAERIEKYNLGWTISHKSGHEEIVALLHRILNDQQSYNEVIESINKYKIKSTVEMSNAYIKMYDKSCYIKTVDTNEILELTKIGDSLKTNVVYNNYAWVFDTLKWKLISKIKVPKPIKTIIRKVRTKR